MTILRIERVVYAVDDVPACVRFFADFGLTPVADTVLATRTGQLVELRPVDDPALPAALEPGPTLREVVWGVAGQRDLDAVFDELRDRPVTVTDNVLHTTDETGFGAGFTVAAVRAVHPDIPGANSLGSVRRWNRPLEPPGRARPLRLCHVALNIPQQGRDEATGFYQRLGFRATDRVLTMGTFLRAPGDEDQHTLLLCHRPDKAGINHTAYEVASFDEVITGANHMIERGWREARRLGRHTIGSNVFRFLHAPCGGRVEYAADMDRVDDTYPTRVHETTPPHHLWTLQTNRDGE